MFRPMRRFKQQLSQEECLAVLQGENRGTLALSGDDGYPYAVPINYYYDPESGHLFFHGAKEGHKLDALARSDKVSFAVHDQGVIEEGDWAYTLHSVIVFGRMHVVEDPERFAQYLYKIGVKYYPNAQMVTDLIGRAGSRVTMLELVPEHMTAKLVHEKPGALRVCVPP